MTEHHTTAFDSKLNEIGFYQQYPEYLPFIGENYAQNKILLIGESHYFPEKSVWHQNPEVWYTGSSKMLSELEQKHIYTRRVLNNIDGDSPAKSGKWKKSRTIFRNLEKVMLQAGFEKEHNLFSQVAFMNAFQRPAEATGDSIKVHQIDVDHAVATINQVIDIIQPKHVCFVSSKASKFLAHQISLKSDHVPHPACVWWNRETKKGLTGKNQFLAFIKQYRESSD